MNRIKRPSDAKAFDLEITDVAYGGKGVGRHNGKVVFVKHVLPGEVVRVVPKKDRPNFISADLIDVVHASPERITSDCLVSVGFDNMGKEHFSQTPGCVYQCFSYQEELRVKHNQFANFIGDPSLLSPPTPAPNHLNYRNKIILHTMDYHGDISLGYCEEKGSEVLDMPNCPLALPEINQQLKEIRAIQGFKSTLKDGMKVTLRFTENDGVLWWRNKPKANASWLKENTRLGQVSVPPGCFFQVNPSVSDILIAKVIAQIKNFSPVSVIDLYCGCGVFSLAAAQSGVKYVSGLDSDQNTIKAAEYNANQMGLPNVRFSADFAEKAFSCLIEEHCRDYGVSVEETLLIVDPPRNGLGRKVRSLLQNLEFKGVIYVSCAPDTLERDLKFFLKGGYRLVNAGMLDMFPRTSHFESLVVLSR